MALEFGADQRTDWSWQALEQIKELIHGMNHKYTHLASATLCNGCNKWYQSQVTTPGQRWHQKQEHRTDARQRLRSNSSKRTLNGSCSTGADQRTDSWNESQIRSPCFSIIGCSRGSLGHSRGQEAIKLFLESFQLKGGEQLHAT